MSVLIESPMDFTFANTAFVPAASTSSSSGIRTSILNSRKRKSHEVITDEFDFTFEAAPTKLLRREVCADDVRKLDVNWSFQMDSNARDYVDRLDEIDIIQRYYTKIHTCSFSDKCLMVTTRRADHRLERRCIPLPDHIDNNSICLCFDSNNCLLIGFNYIPGFRVTPCIA
uniref:Uncharacterized protein n=1 Tax=Panagrolaimus sp. PS1159 TaxID=55785 RepID=A0AC35FJH0_9BILA